MKSPVLGFFSTAGEAGLVADDGADFSVDDVPFLVSLVCAGAAVLSLVAAGMFTFVPDG